VVAAFVLRPLGVQQLQLIGVTGVSDALPARDGVPHVAPHHGEPRGCLEVAPIRERLPRYGEGSLEVRMV